MALILPDANRCIRLFASGDNGVTGWGNVFYLQYAGTPPSSANLRSIATQFATAFDNGPLNQMTVGAHLTKIQTVDLNSRTGAVDEYSLSLAGSQTGAVTPAQVSVCISRKIARRYRGGHPRFYLAAIPQSAMLDQRNLDGTYLLQTQGEMDAFLVDVNAITVTGPGVCKMVNVSYWETLTPHAPPTLKATPAIDLITALAVNNRVDTQRRRVR